ncbi:MAG: hypothetical protein OEW09_16980, partial [Anaerolineae bacterium]|nr:hypothetical protein [Anaerolineae bacterium]
TDGSPGRALNQTPGTFTLFSTMDMPWELPSWAKPHDGSFGQSEGFYEAMRFVDIGLFHNVTCRCGALRC